MPVYRPEGYRVAVFCPTDRERAAALAILDPSNVEVETEFDSLAPPQPNGRRLHAYRGVLTSWCDDAELEALHQAHLLVDVLRPPVTEPSQDPPVTEPSQDAIFARHERLSQADPRAGTMRAHSDRVAIGDAAAGLVVTQAAGQFRESENDMYLVTLREPLDSDRRALLDRIGATITEFEPPSGYWMYLDPQQHQTLAEQWWVGQMRPRSWVGSLTSELVEVIVPAPGEPSLWGAQEEPLPPEQYDVLLHDPQHLPWARDTLAATAGVEVVFAVDVMIRIKITLAGDELSAMLAAVSRLHEVRDVTPYRPPALYIDHARTLVGLAALAQPAVPAGQLDGTGQIVAMFDSGVDASHPDLADRIVALQALVGSSPQDVLGHGTHVAGIIAGTGKASGGKLTGCAPGASLAVFRITDDDGAVQVPPCIGEFLKYAVDAGAKIVNLSWGRRMSAGGYDGYALSLDRFVFEHPQVLVVVAAGNEGEAPEGKHLFNTIGTPATAKNALTVGASDTDRAEFAEKTWSAFRGSRFPKPPAGAEHVAGSVDLPAALSGRGPTDAGSVKPDVLAPGTFILSTKLMSSRIDRKLIWQECPDFDGHYVYIGGTSMATPVVAGAAAVLRQHLMQARGEQSPSAALLKAMLIAAARPVPSLREADSEEDVGYPDFDQGYGRLDLSTLLPSQNAPAGRALSYVDIENDSAEALEAFAPAGGNRVSCRGYQIGVTAGQDPLRIVLTWTDHPGNSVQNNLNLGVRTPDGKTLVGNARHTFHKDAGLFDQHHLDQYRSHPLDKLNSVEQVSIENPVQGEYSIQVLAQVTTFPPQGYSLVVSGQLDGQLRPEA